VMCRILTNAMPRLSTQLLSAFSLSASDCVGPIAANRKGCGRRQQWQNARRYLGMSRPRFELGIARIKSEALLLQSCSSASGIEDYASFPWISN
jgi:hypothetical protein